MRVLIVNTNRERSPYTLIPLGACSVASAARAAGYATRLLDLTFARFPSRAAAKAVRSFRPDVVGLSVRNLDNCDRARPHSYLPEIRSLASACRRAGAGILVLGGPAVTTAPRPALDYLGGDFAVLGEGETALPALLDAIELGQDPARVPGVVARWDGGDAIHSPAVAGDLSSFSDASPEDWLDLGRYRGFDAAMPVQTKRGCPFRCAYCAYPAIEGAGIRLRDPEQVASDVWRAARLGFRVAEFVDSVFNVPESHAVACCESIARRQPGVALQTLEFNPSACSPGLVRAMNAAGFCAVGCTAESGSDAMLASLRKGFNTAALRRTARELCRLDAIRLWIFMLGGPGETEETIRQTADFIARCLTARDLVYVSCGIRILPGTELHERAVAEGIVSSSDDLLEPAFYFSPHLSPERAMAAVAGSGFPTANIVSLADGNHRLLPLVQRIVRLMGLSPPYWRWAPVWNRTRRMLASGEWRAASSEPSS